MVDSPGGSTRLHVPFSSSGGVCPAAALAHSDGASRVVLASGEDFPDALAAGGLAGSLGAPILLTPPDRLDDAALEDLGAEENKVMGGADAVDDAAERDARLRHRRAHRDDERPHRVDRASLDTVYLLGGSVAIGDDIAEDAAAAADEPAGAQIELRGGVGRPGGHDDRQHVRRRQRGQRR